MQKQNSLRQSIILAIVAAIYVALTVLVAPFSYGMIQFRISEILNHLLIFNKKYIVSLGIGVLLANFFSSAGLVDVIVGSATTVMCSLISIVVFKKLSSQRAKFAFNVFNFSVIGMIPIAIMLDVLGFTDQTLIVSYVFLVISEAIVMVIGIGLITLIQKHIPLNEQ